MGSMRNQLVVAAALVAGVLTHGSAQNGRRSVQAPSRRDDQGTTTDTRFTPALRSGQTLAVSNIDGNVTVTQGRGTAAEIVAHKTVRRGNGDLVKAVLEETSSGYRVCTVYRNDDNDSQGCDHNTRNDNNHARREPLDVDMAYEVRIPAGVILSVNSVDGDVEARGIDTPATLRTVDGSITFDGVAPRSLNTVDGAITATITDTDWNHSLAVRSVDGEIQLTLPAAISLSVSGHTVDGEINSDFPLTIAGKWGPQSFHGEIGSGRGPELELNTVDGGIHLQSSDSSHRGSTRGKSRRGDHR
jgi:putative adhesin